MTADPIAADCRMDYRAAHDSGRRDVDVIRWVVLHSTEGGTAESIARYFASASATGSAHLVVDDNACYRTLPNAVIPWAAPGANTAGFHIEQCGFARWSAVVWRSHLRTLNRAAFKAAHHCVLFGIPPLWVDAAGLRAGRFGVTSHAECTRAFGGTHTDPGRLWPRSLFMSRVRSYYADAMGADV